MEAILMQRENEDEKMYLARLAMETLKRGFLVVLPMELMKLLQIKFMTI